MKISKVIPKDILLKNITWCAINNLPYDVSEINENELLDNCIIREYQPIFYPSKPTKSELQRRKDYTGIEVLPESTKECDISSDEFLYIKTSDFNALNDISTIDDMESFYQSKMDSEDFDDDFDDWHEFISEDEHRSEGEILHNIKHGVSKVDYIIHRRGVRYTKIIKTHCLCFYDTDELNMFSH